ncbi:MAG: hypothetical protein ACI912_000600, partial [Marinobacter psychrophilus]
GSSLLAFKSGFSASSQSFDVETLHLWSSQDALVLKMLAMALPDTLALSPLCTHIRDMGVKSHREYPARSATRLQLRDENRCEKLL